MLDKPSGMSSNSALQAARRLFSAAKAGHTGTLDPLASGLLPLCFGEATKFSADLFDADKTYEAEVLFGITTDTGDSEGEVIRREQTAFNQQALEAVLERFRGPISQIPPMYSALKRDGKPLYKLARQGIEVERKPRDVTIHELHLLDFSGERCKLAVTCSKGTYIRTLAEDIGNALGCGAHLIALRRTRVGDLTLAGAVSLDELGVLAEEARPARLQAPDALLQTLPVVHLDENATVKFSHGNPVTAAVNFQGKCRVYCGNRLLGIGEAEPSGKVSPRRLVCS